MKMSVKGVKKKEQQLPVVTTSGLEHFDLEQQFILRLPEDAASQLHEDLKENSGVQIKDKLSIELDKDLRHGRVRYGGDIFFAKLLDLPCIVESMKTVDQKTFYKTSDISQMLFCRTDEDWTEEDNESPKKKEKEKKFIWNHGITPPLKNVRKRRFRKTLRKKYMDQPEVEKEVRRLFRSDSEAIDVKYEIIVDDEKSELGQLQDGETGGSQNALLGAGELGTEALFGELSSSEEDEEEDKDINIMDSGGDDDVEQGNKKQVDGSSSEIKTPALTDSEAAALQEKIKVLMEQLEEIRERRTHQEDQLATQEDEQLKSEMQAALTQLVQEQSEKERELDMVSAMLND